MCVWVCVCPPPQDFLEDTAPSADDVLTAEASYREWLAAVDAHNNTDAVYATGSGDGRKRTGGSVSVGQPAGKAQRGEEALVAPAPAPVPHGYDYAAYYQQVRVCVCARQCACVFCGCVSV